MRERVIDKSVHQVTEFASTQHFLETGAVPAGISTIYDRGLPIDLLVHPAQSDTTIFFFHGAIEQHFKLPVLSGLGISGGLDANRVFLSDPSLMLDEQLLLAWYAGNYKQPDLQQVLTKIIQKITNSLSSEKIVFFGGSGGGFASLYFASQFDNALALVFNPQTNIRKYTQRAVKDFAAKAFHTTESKEATLNQLPPNVVIDICEIYKAPVQATVAYLQNDNDHMHVQSHLIPFAETIHSETDFLVLTEPWRDGHTPPPKDLLTKTLNLATASENWVRDLQKIGFQKRAVPKF